MKIPPLSQETAPKSYEFMLGRSEVIALKDRPEFEGEIFDARNLERPRGNVT